MPLMRVRDCRDPTIANESRHAERGVGRVTSSYAALFTELYLSPSLALGTETALIAGASEPIAGVIIERPADTIMQSCFMFNILTDLFDGVVEVFPGVLLSSVSLPPRNVLLSPAGAWARFFRRLRLFGCR